MYFYLLTIYIMKKDFIKDWKIYKRTCCEVWSRVMWYYRSVNNFNEWKKAEFYNRLNFSEEKSNNSKFMLQYS